MKSILALLLLTFSVGILAENDPVVATVNGKTIRKSTLLAYHQQNLNFIQGSKEVTLERSLNDLVDRIIGIENAKQKKIHERPEVVKKMNDVVYHAFISQELTPKLQEIKVTDADIENYYKKFPEYKTSQILLRLRTLPSDEEIANVTKQASELFKEASKTENSKGNIEKFAALAQKYSQNSGAITGGDMGYQPRTRLTKQYFEAIHNQPIGKVVKARSQYGWHIIMVTGVKKYEQIDKKLYEKIVYDQKRDAILSKYFASQRKKAKVEIDKKALQL